MRWLWSVALALLAFSPAVYAAGPGVSAALTLPFRISWTRGVCRNCQRPMSLDTVVSAGEGQALALGYLPSRGEGSGEWEVVRSRDAGRTWRELRWSHQYNEPPGTSFADPRAGWIAITNIPDAELRLQMTRDGGATWRRLGLQDFGVSLVKYVGRGVGYAYNSDPDGKAYLYRTRDDGRHWRKTNLPPGFEAEQMSFFDARRGYLAGCLARRLTVLSTGDGGGHWITASLTSPATSPGGSCDVEFHSASNTGMAWLLATKAIFGPGDTDDFMRIWRTPDYGRTWISAYQTRWKDESDHQVRYSGPYALGPKLVVAFKNGPGGKGEALYSADDGRSWATAPMNRPISGCDGGKTVLSCGGVADHGFWLATLKAPSPR